MLARKRLSKSVRPTRILNKVASSSSNFFLNHRRNVHVAVIGAAGAVGSPLCMLLKQMPLISKVTLFDKVPHILGIGKECSHIQAKAKVRAFKKPKYLNKAVRGADIIVLCHCTCGIHRPDSDKTLFEKNSKITEEIANVLAKVSPNAVVLVVTNPVNMMVPLISEVYKERKVYNPQKIIGLTILNTVRANRFVASALNINPFGVRVPVIGGNTCDTIVPIFSQASPSLSKLTKDKIKQLTEKVKESGAAIIKMKTDEPSKTIYSLAMSYAAARFITSLCMAKLGRSMIETCYVRSNVCNEVKYLSSPCKLGIKGVKKICEIPKLNHEESCQLDVALKALKKDIKMGTDFIKDKCK